MLQFHGNPSHARQNQKKYGETKEEKTMSIPQETRRESMEKTYETVVPISKKILKLIQTHGPFTAWQLSRVMNKEVYTVRPRLSELKDSGDIREKAKAWCEQTQRNETVWEAVNPQLSLI